MLDAVLGEPVGDEPEDGSPRGSATPAPFSQPHPLVFLGGGAAAARRAGRLGTNYQPQLDDPALTELYRDVVSAEEKPAATAAETVEVGA